MPQALGKAAGVDVAAAQQSVGSPSRWSKVTAAALLRCCTSALVLSISTRPSRIPVNWHSPPAAQAAEMLYWSGMLSRARVDLIKGLIMQVRRVLIVL